MHTTSVRFGDDTWEAVRAVAEREGVPLSHLIREAVIVRLATGVRPSDAAELRGDVDSLSRRLAHVERALGIRRR